MKFHLQTPNENVVTGTGPGWIRIGPTEYRTNVLLLEDKVIEGWTSGTFDTLTEADFAKLIEYRPEILLLGTGATQRFPHPRLLAPLNAERIGVEIMDTRAAARTFNILVAEGRKVVAALILE